MSITGYANRFGLLRLAGIIAEQAFNVAGFLLNSGKPLDDDLRRIAADVREIRKLLDDGRGSGKDVGERAEESSGADAMIISPTSPSLTSAVAPVVHSPNPEDAAEAPRAATPPHYSEGRPGHPNVEDIVDEYWDEGGFWSWAACL